MAGRQRSFSNTQNLILKIEKFGKWSRGREKLSAARVLSRMHVATKGGD
jgi:hypothetical protein